MRGYTRQFEVQRGLPMTMLVKYFRRTTAIGGLPKIYATWRTFREWNLLDDLRPLGIFDVIFCRNVLIYFDPPTKTKALDAIARQMAPDGVLYLGGAETVLGVTDRFAPIAGDRGVYALTAAQSAGSARTLATTTVR